VTVPLIENPPFSLPQNEKRERLAQELSSLTDWHQKNCRAYHEILTRNRSPWSTTRDLESIPFIPVRLFKHRDLLSVPRESIIKTVTSSGTSNQSVSKIYLDKETATNQTRVLVKILQNFIGVQRMPMLIIDHPNVVKNRQMFSARGAGILGLSNFGIDHTYALKDESMEIDYGKIHDFLTRHSGKTLLIFGFTYMVWQYLVRQLESANRSIDLSNGVMLHSGGWKKLTSEAVSATEFAERLIAITNCERVHNFYGMAEQVGTIYVECEHHRLHVPIFSDVLIRNPLNWKLQESGEEGLVQLLSILPHSYPGHSLLTEDVGVITGIDNCPCGRLGKTIRVIGRLPKSETRGCSDTHAG
jgi:phenylacetate-coenzyme A ligase PaaK-like adenylate-forming protein